MDGEDKSVEDIGMDTPFYTVWGDPICAAGLCKYFRDNGFEVTVEEVIKHPTIRGQIRWLKGLRVLYEGRWKGRELKMHEARA